MTKGIKSTADLTIGALYTTNGSDVWELHSYCLEPTATVRNIRTGELRGGAVGSLILGDLIPLQPTEPLPEVHIEPVPWADK